MSTSCPRCGTNLAEEANFCVACGADLREDEGDFKFSPPDPLVGQIVADRYHILELVGRGGMGVVYKVEHVRMGKLMAMKLLHGELSRDREVVKRFKREATAVSRLSHPNTVQVFDFGRSDGLMYLIMEYIEGRELARLVREKGPIAFDRCASIVAQICSSLTEAHDQGIIHRDLKPENVLLRKTKDAQELVKVLDFGLAKLRETEDRADTTCQGVLVGTPHYMSPEQIRGEDIDHRSDIYSLGALMFKVLTGEPPFPANTPVAVLTKHLSEPPPSIFDRKPELPFPDMADEIIRCCLAKEADDRFSSVNEIRELMVAYLAELGSGEFFMGDSGVMARTSKTPGAKETPKRENDDVVEPRTSVPDGAMRVGDRLIQIGSRGEFERLERAWKRRRVASWIIALLVCVVILAFGGSLVALQMELEPVVELSHRIFAPTDREEREPNDEPELAERFWLGTKVRGTVGKRYSKTESDRDWFVIRKNGGAVSAFDATITPIPRMDLVLQAIAFDRNGSTTIAEANAGGPGEPERLEGIDLDRPELYLLVREVWVLGRPPTENVSDFYELTVEAATPPN